VNFFNPFINSSFIFTANQQLLNGFGLLANERNIRIARLNKNLADETFQQQVITTITAVGNAYWELAFARGNVDVSLHQIELANKLYSDNKKQVDIGTLAPLEIVQAEAQGRNRQSVPDRCANDATSRSTHALKLNHEGSYRPSLAHY